MRYSVIIFTNLLLINLISAQSPCLPDGINFATQEEIDSFPVNFTGCTEIAGNIEISGDDIVNLNGLSVLKSIWGDVSIYQNGFLVNLFGLEGLDSIGGVLLIGFNPNLSSLQGLNNLKYVSGDFVSIYENITLTDLSGLENLTFINGSLAIGRNSSLLNLIGLEKVTSIEGGLGMWENDAMTSLTGLDSLQHLGGDLRIGISGWNYAAGNHSLLSISALKNLTTVGGFCQIYGNDMLSNLTGLDSLASIGGFFSIESNNALANLDGLANLKSINGDLYINDNHTLDNLSGLENLTEVNGEIEIIQNESLYSLIGLENIKVENITFLSIEWNDILSECSIQSVCDYLELPAGWASIHSNGVGCNYLEVKEACNNQDVEKRIDLNSFRIWPNPTKNGIIHLSSEHIKGRFQLTIFNYTGQIVHKQNVYNDKTLIDISILPSGIYLAKVHQKSKSIGKVKFSISK